MINTQFKHRLASNVDFLVVILVKIESEIHLNNFYKILWYV